jgi:alkanesulfonate monooxygenase SsuD/methylene tetrahydromethanopterin reductase-like flavin-dependent oxidoreductase (luciferase family)
MRCFGHKMTNGSRRSAMNVGVYFDLRNAPQWPQDAARVYGFTLEMCEEAERLGAHSIWLSEHHLFDDGYLPQPLTFAAAVAARTARLRIGTAVLLAPMRSAAQIAEEAAIVDLISGGRLELGLGAGYRVPEFELFGADMARRYTTTDQRVRDVRDLWAEGRITPEPAQSRVPIWLGYQGPQGAARAGRLGEGLLSANAALAEPYLAGLDEAGHDRSVARMAGVVPGWVTDDPDADWPAVSQHLAYQLDSYRRYMVEGTEQSLPKPVDPERVRTRPIGGPLGGFVHATPEEMAVSVRELTAGAPVETVFLWGSIGGMPEELVADHVHTICTRLAPLLASAGSDGR